MITADVTATTSTLVSASIEIPGVSPAEVFDWLCDTTNHVTNDGSGHVVKPIGAATLSAKGDTFGMQMKWVVPYRVTNTVVEFDRDTRIAWRHFAGHRWRYELEPVAGGTRVTESFDISRTPTLARPSYSLFFDFPDGYATTLRHSLEQLRDQLQAVTDARSADDSARPPPIRHGRSTPRPPDHHRRRWTPQSTPPPTRQAADYGASTARVIGTR